MQHQRPGGQCEKHELLENSGNILEKARLSSLINQCGSPEQVQTIKDEMAGLNSKKRLIGEVISEDTFWACTTCPHCLNALKHDYPLLGGNFEVIHHAEFIDGLIKSGKIRLKTLQPGALTYHDPCYLGRYNNIYDQPRSILNSISQAGLRELGRHGRESFCCGAGGGRMWMEETIGKRINVERAKEIVGLNVPNVAVGCPFCLTMIEDGMKELGREEEIRTLGIAELVEKNMA